MILNDAKTFRENGVKPPEVKERLHGKVVLGTGYLVFTQGDKITLLNERGKPVKLNCFPVRKIRLEAFSVE